MHMIICSSQTQACFTVGLRKGAYAVFQRHFPKLPVLPYTLRFQWQHEVNIHYMLSISGVCTIPEGLVKQPEAWAILSVSVGFS